MHKSSNYQSFQAWTTSMPSFRPFTCYRRLLRIFPSIKLKRIFYSSHYNLSLIIDATNAQNFELFTSNPDRLKLFPKANCLIHRFLTLFCFYTYSRKLTANFGINRYLKQFSLCLIPKSLYRQSYECAPFRLLEDSRRLFGIFQ